MSEDNKSEFNEFLTWLDNIAFLLPPDMTLHDARLLHKSKLKQEAEKKDDETD